MTPPRDTKCTISERVHVYEALRDALTRLARLHGMSRGEYIRFLLENHVYGHAHRLEYDNNPYSVERPREAQRGYGGTRR